jgi:hypothetical protein
MELHGKDFLEGKIIAVSNGPEDSYAVVEVQGLSQMVVVAMNKLEEKCSE